MSLHGSQEIVQRRAACRIEPCLEVRYRDLACVITGHEWKTAELRDVSLGGASFLIRDESIDVGHRLLLELSLNDTLFTLPAVVRRIERHHKKDAAICAVQYLELDAHLQVRMEKALTHLQLKLISSRVKVD